jgi:DNA-binding transcriptional LysR family regulator
MTSILEKTTGLAAFVRTVDAGSFSAASRMTGATQSAISKSVARLERRLGVRLFQRSTRTLSLTAEGQAYYERVAPLLRAIDDAEDVVQAASTARGTLRVSAPQEFGRMLIATWAGDFLDRYPEVKLELDITDRLVDIIRESYDVAIRMGRLRDSDLVSRRLTNLRWALVAAPRYAERHGLPNRVEELAAHSCLRYVTGGKPWPYAFSDGTSIVPASRFDTDDSGSIRQAAVAGAGIAYLLRVTVAEDIAAGRLVEVLPQLAMPTLQVFALHSFGRQLPLRARLFIDFLVEKSAASDI